VNKPHESEKKFTKGQYALGIGALIVAPLIYSVGDAKAATLHQKVVRVDQKVKQEEAAVWLHNLSSDGRRPTLFTTHTSSRDGVHFKVWFRAYTGRRGHRHLVLKLRLRAVIIKAVIEEEEFLYEDGTGYVYYDSGHSLFVVSTSS